MAIILKSHGFKYSRPEANYVMDVSFFINPWRDKKIREEQDKDKRKKMIMKFMEDQEGVNNFVTRVSSLLRLLSMMYPDENLQVAICCSAGEYRSPAIVEMISENLGKVPHTVIQNINSKI